MRPRARHPQARRQVDGRFLRLAGDGERLAGASVTFAKNGTWSGSVGSTALTVAVISPPAPNHRVFRHVEVTHDADVDGLRRVRDREITGTVGDRRTGRHRMRRAACRRNAQPSLEALDVLGRRHGDERRGPPVPSQRRRVCRFMGRHLAFRVRVGFVDRRRSRACVDDQDLRAVLDGPNARSPVSRKTGPSMQYRVGSPNCMDRST
jgi:hypothetical protein